MYNGAGNVSSGVDRVSNGGGLEEGDSDVPRLVEGSDEEDAGSNVENEESEKKVNEKKVKVEVLDDSEDDEYDVFVKTLPNSILAMIDIHMLTHRPYANWCPSCVRGRGAMYAHPMIKERATKSMLFAEITSLQRSTLQY